MNLELPRYQAKQVREAGQQFYVNTQGDRLPSVTTILNATKSREDRDRLFNWKQRVGVEQAAEITKTASRRGTGLHRHIQRYLQGEVTECTEFVRPYWDSVQPILDSLTDIQLVEGMVVHDQLRYAGVADCIATFEGVSCLCEWKTSDRPKQTIERLYDYPLQVVAYCGAANQHYQEYNLNLCHALVVVAIPETPAEIFWFEPAAIAAYWEQWESRVRQYWRRLGYFG